MKRQSQKGENMESSSEEGSPKGYSSKGWQGALSCRVGNMEQALLRMRGTGQKTWEVWGNNPLLRTALSTHCFLISELQAAEAVGRA